MISKKHITIIAIVGIITSHLLRCNVLQHYIIIIIIMTMEPWNVLNARDSWRLRAKTQIEKVPTMHFWWVMADVINWFGCGKNHYFRYIENWSTIWFYELDTKEWFFFVWFRSLIIKPKYQWPSCVCSIRSLKNRSIVKKKKLIFKIRVPKLRLA